MAKKFQFTDALALKKSQLMLAFLWALCSHNSAHAQLRVFALGAQHAGLGVLSTQQWQHEGLKTPATRTWNYAHAQAGARYTLNDWSVVAYESREVYFKGDNHVLTLASEYERTEAINTQAIDNLQVQGQLQWMESRHLGVSKRWNWHDQGWIELEPHIFQIQKYEHIQLDLSLQNTGTNQQTLSGNVNRVGTQVYGFDLNNRPDAGTGWGLNVRGAWHNPWGKTALNIHNAAGALNFSNVHYSNRRYNVVTTQSKISPQETPALLGRYGQFSQQEKLPIFWQIHQQWQALPGLSTGLLGLNRQSSLQASYTHPFSHGHIKLTQTGLYQTQVSGLWQPIPALSLGLGMGVFKGRYPQWTNMVLNLQL